MHKQHTVWLHDPSRPSWAVCTQYGYTTLPQPSWAVWLMLGSASVRMLLCDPLSKGKSTKKKKIHKKWTQINSATICSSQTKYTEQLAHGFLSGPPNKASCSLPVWNPYPNPSATPGPSRTTVLRIQIPIAKDQHSLFLILVSGLFCPVSASHECDVELLPASPATQIIHLPSQ